MPPREFIDIALQVLGRLLVVDADEAPFQQCSEAFHTVRMRLVAHILTHGVVHCLVRLCSFPSHPCRFHRLQQG